MNVTFTTGFQKRFQKLPVKVQEKFEKRMELFVKNPLHPLLKCHPLKGNMIGLRSFSVTGDYRVIYQLTGKDSAKLIDIGTHGQVYGN